jgi:hypothetical protein
MTEDMMQIAIAKHLAELDGYYTLSNGGRAKEVPLKYLEGDGGVFPDYTKDLNAMHRAELKLDDGKRREFREQLCIVCLMDGGPIHATASQRATAFLIAIGKL